jgi:hypothetical protein
MGEPSSQVFGRQVTSGTRILAGEDALTFDRPTRVTTATGQPALIDGQTVVNGAIPRGGSYGYQIDADPTAATDYQVTAGGDEGIVTGLASLHLQLPDTEGMYRAYRFTTVRGDVQITGRAASQSLLVRLGQLAAVLLAIAVVAYLVRRWRRGGFAWLASRAGAATLACLGLLMLLLGFLPVVGVAAVVAAIVIVCRRAAARQATTVIPEVVPE